ncbi:MAG TPA: SDR family oxidoreductase [Verrucomicrobiae bacterium]|nr:SDR family oxidoreductase [Verrucomicrobiae bacterium]
MKNLHGKWALVTGASSGLGVEFAKLFAERNANLVLVARRTEPMEQLAEALRKEQSVQVVVMGMDLSQPGAAAELKAQLDARGIEVEVLVNNAGFGAYGDFLDQSVEKLGEMMRLNVMALTELTHIFGWEMANRGHGRVLLVASVLGYQAVPGYAAYAATKGYVLLLGEALHQELSPRGVSVTTVSPGATATAFSAVAGEKSSLVLKALRMKPQVVAKTAVLAAMRDKASVVPGFLNKANVFMDRLMPRSMQRMVFGRVMAG